MEVQIIDNRVERDTIMQTAFAVLSQSDIPTSRRELARRAGVTPAALQRHFRSLADLQAEMTKVSAFDKANGAQAEEDQVVV